MRSHESPIGQAALVVSALLVSYQTAGKALRDAIFLAHYEVSQLPAMVMATAVATIVLSLVSARWIAQWGPGRVVVRVLLLSGVMQFAEWAALGDYPKIVAPVVYLHVVGLTEILGSGFWSMLSEVVHLRQARRLFGRIATWGTAGGVLGGLAAERLGAWFGTNAVLGQLGMSHLLCAALLWRFAGRARAAVAEEEEPESSVWQSFTTVPYMGSLAVLVLLGTCSAAALDFLFKAQARETYGQGPELLRFLALFHTASAVLTFGLQWVIGKVSSEKMGLTVLAGSVPAVVGTGSILTALLPGLPVIAGTRMLEASARVSLFKNGYELFYTPIPAREKRAVKTFIDVVCDRMGDAASSVIVQTALVAAPGSVRYIVLGFTTCAALVSLRITGKLDTAYHAVVERGLLKRANEVNPGYVENLTTMSGAFRDDSSGMYGLPMAAPVVKVNDPVVATLAELRSGDLARVRAALAGLGGKPLDPVLAPALVALLAWDEVAYAARDVLAVHVERFTGLLLDSLRDPGQEFAVRRRLPRILASHPGQLVCDGLIQGLEDDRFEVRFQCGRGLDRVKRKMPALRVDEEPIYAAVVREVSVNKQIWDSKRLLDEREEEDEFSFLDDVLRERAHQSMEHVFSLLALVLPREPVRTAFRALHSGDRALMDLALEYLERAVPAEVRAVLWPVLEVRPGSVSEEVRERAARDLLLTERGLMVALQKIEDV